MSDSLGDRMKRYEGVSQTSLMRRAPIIVRCDGKAFHTLTHGCDKPFDANLMRAMDEAALALCKDIQGCKLAYIQSDEISLLLTDFDRLNQGAWFENNLQKMVSVSASLATAYFNANYKGDKMALFDSRAFSLPEHEVCNYFVWRQQDAVRNSVQMCARSLFSHKELIGKKMGDMKRMMYGKGLDWDSMSLYKQRGRCAVKWVHETKDTVRSGWRIDYSIPLFTESREYIESLMIAEE